MSYYEGSTSSEYTNGFQSPQLFYPTNYLPVSPTPWQQHVVGMMRREKDPLACLKGIHASIARMNEEGRRTATNSPLSYMHPVVILPAAGCPLVTLNNLEKWDGKRE